MKRLLALAAAALIAAPACAQMVGGVMESQAHSATNFTGVLATTKGGTGVANNAASTLTISGAFATTLTVSGTTGVTLPTSGVLARVTGETFVTPNIGTATGAGLSLNSATVSRTLNVKGATQIADFQGTAASALIEFTPTSQDQWRLGAGNVNVDDFGIHNVTRSKTNLSFAGGASGALATLGVPMLISTGTTASQLRTAQTTVPTCTTNCGTGSPTVAGTDTAGIITLGTTPASAFQVNFNGTWAAAPSCIVQSALATMVVGKMPIAVVTTTTTMTVTTNGTAPATSDKYQYHCIGVS